MPQATDPTARGAAAATVIRTLAALLAAWTLVVAVSGGVDLRSHGIPFRSTDASRPLLAAALLLLVYIARFRSRASADLDRLSVTAAPVAAAIVRRSGLLALLVSIAAVAAGMWFGIHVAAGSDSWGYISQVRLWLAGDLVTEQPIATQVPWPEADWTFAPLGYRPALTPGAIVPVYAPGLGMLMALATLLVGTCGPYVVVPLLGGALVWLTYRVGTQVWSAAVGLSSAVLMATSPTFLFMLMNPMSDVPASAFLLAAAAAALTRWRRRAWWTGVAASAAILIRPNLVPVGAVFLAMLLARREDRRWQTAAWFGAGGLPLVMVVAAVNTHLYGAPWKAGYGSLDQFYAWSHAVPNLVQYPTWLLQTETPFVVLMLVPLAVMHRLDAPRRAALTFVALIAAAVWLCYLFYAPYDVWWYLRFLLPAIPPMLILAAIGAAWLVHHHVEGRKTVAVVVLMTAALLALRLNEIRERALLSLWRGGVVYLSAAQYVRANLPENAVILTVQHSGSIRYYADRLTMRWDLLPAEWWPRALDVLVDRGYRPYLLISSFEEEQLREWFSLSARVDAPGTVVAEMTMPERLRIYDPLRRTDGEPAMIAPVTPCPCGRAPARANGF